MGGVMSLLRKREILVFFIDILFSIELYYNV